MNVTPEEVNLKESEDMYRGINFEIPNAHGNFLGEILKPMDVVAYDWFIGGEESYYIVDNTLGDNLFPERVFGMDGGDFKTIIDSNIYYLIFADLKAYPQGAKIVEVTTYEEYQQSECQLVLLVVDCIYATIYCKDLKLLEELYLHITDLGYHSLEYITDENDARTKLSVW